MYSEQNWQAFYNTIAGEDWPQCPSLNDIATLPDFIKKEIIFDFKGHHLFIDDWDQSMHQRVDLVPINKEFNYLRPKKIQNLIRVGSTYDGGYIVPRQMLQDANLLSGGIAENWDFEKHWNEINPLAVIHAYDRDVNIHSEEYSKMWTGNKHHYANYLDANDVPFEDAVNNIPGDKIFVKLDIEGAEYSCIDGIVKNENRIIGMTIEFHNINLTNNFFDSIKRLQTGYEIVHMHANNVTSPPENGLLPHLLEITMVRRDYLDKLEVRNHVYLCDLDRPNFYNKCDIFMYFADD